MSAPRTGSKPDETLDSPVDTVDGDAAGSALRAYVTYPTVPRMRAVSGHYPLNPSDLLHPTYPPERELQSHSRVKIDPPEAPGSIAPESVQPDTKTERHAPTTDRCGPIQASASIAPATRDRPVFVRLDGAEAGQVVSLVGETVTVGRDTSASLHLADVGVSRCHAELFVRKNKLWVHDLESRNGTFVNGMRISKHQLREGDLIQFGPRASFRFSLMDGAQEHALQRLYDSSIHDGLTGAYNRRYFEERLRMEIAFAMRHKTDCALVLCDIDHFKQVNDRHGHGVGDTALKHLVALCSSSLRVEDVLARYGGEEFVILLRDVGLDGAIRAAERIRHHVRNNPVDLGDRSLNITISAGCAALSECARSSPEGLLLVADQRLYAAKRQGRDRVIARDA